MKIILFGTIISLFSMSVALALEIDEKLTVRLLRVSSSKKTVLVNRGLEDGLVVGDHAKFFRTTGVIARGVIEKASPSRSIWAIYRVVDPAFIDTEKVMNIKIASPVKLTGDQTRMLVVDKVVGVDRTESIPLSENADDLPNEKELSGEEKAEMNALSGNSEIRRLGALSGLQPSRTIDIWAMAYYNGMSSSTDLGSSGAREGKNSSVDFSAGIEKYFSPKTDFISNLSIAAFLHYGSNMLSSIEGDQAETSVFEYGLGVYYHFLARPTSYGRFIGYVGGGGAYGSCTDNIETAERTNSTKVKREPYKGTSNSFFGGAGLKYFTETGIGFRAFLDYYRRGEVYEVNTTDGQYTRVVAGPRMHLGMSIKF